MDVRSAAPLRAERDECGLFRSPHFRPAASATGAACQVGTRDFSAGWAIRLSDNDAPTGADLAANVICSLRPAQEPGRGN